ncbi:MAG TPA: reverse transcriptase domain-containing protein, partial [Chryseosolibacter sp.]
VSEMKHDVKKKKRKGLKRPGPQVEPGHFTQIKSRSDAQDWYSAIETEIKDLEKRGTFELVKIGSVPQNENILPSHFTFQAKRNGRKKARWVAGGDKQVKRLLDDFASPTLKTSSLYSLVAIGAHKRLSLRFLDIKNAYLWADLPEPVFTHLPQGFSSNKETSGKCCKLKKGLYGLKESGRLWFETLKESLKLFNLEQNKFDPCVFYNTKHDVYLGTYVDDLIILAPEDTTNKIEQMLNEKFETQRSEFDYLGVSITSSDEGFKLSHFKLSHERYAKEMLERFGMENCNPKSIPLPVNCELVPAGEGEQVDYPMKEASGCLLWLARFRPDLSYAAHQISKIASAPSAAHIAVFKHTLQYIKGTSANFMEFPFDPSSNLQLMAFSDANWANDPVTRKSCGGALIYAGPYLVSFYAKGQPNVATSSAHSEILEISRACRQIMFLKNFLCDMGFMQEPIKVYTDSACAISATAKLICSEENKHFGVRIQEIKEYRDTQFIQLLKVIGTDNAADIMTNQRGKVHFEHLLSNLRKPIVDEKLT